MDQRTKRWLWILAGVLVFVVLVVHHNITEQEIIIFCVLVPSIILHEISHGYVANAFGDDTAKRAGRLSLNPAVHVDPVGTLIVPALLSLGSVGFFGWAKPVPVNTARLRSPRNQGVVVSLAGPAVNAVLAAIFGLAFVHFSRADVLATGRFSTGAQILFWPTYLKYRQYTMPILLGLVLLNFFLYPHGPLTWLFDRLYNWWESVLGV
jgi:Zn-dependent protease